MERTLRDDLLGDTAWNGLQPAARTFIATGEQLYRSHRSDPAFDFGNVCVDFGRALEVQCNDLLRRIMPKLSREERLANIEGHTVDLADGHHLMLGQLGRAIGGERRLNEALALRLEHGGWFTSSLPAVLEEFARVRNAGAHVARVDRRTATHWRNQLLGVGCTGVFVDLAKVRPK